LKITKSQLKRIIKEELKEYAMEPPMAGGPSPCGEEPVDLESEVQRLYDEWQPQTPEGQKYKDDLGAIMHAPGASEPAAAGADWPLSHEFE
jgi:hypothetical protein